MGGHRGALTPWPDARALAARVAAGARREQPAEHVALRDALGATLADDLVARIGLPAFDASAMDGYAVRGAGPWTVAGAGLAGRERAVPSLSEGQAVEIATGARVPEGTGAVLPYEAAERVGDVVRGTVEPGRHVRWVGEDIQAGTTVLRKGTAVTPAVLGLAASLAHDTLPVARTRVAPRVLPLVTGDEVRPFGVPEGGMVRDAIGPVLPGVVRWAGGVAEPTEYVADSFAALRAAVKGVSERGGPEVIVVCGASSAGPADHLRGVLRALEASVVVDGVACRPGHPQLLARSGSEEGPGPIVVGLPGNPYAALVAALTLLVPVIAGLAGRADPATLPPRSLPLREGARSHNRDTRLVAVRVEEGHAVPLGHDRPGSLYGAALADALAVIPPGWAGPVAELVWLPR